MRALLRPSPASPGHSRCGSGRRPSARLRFVVLRPVLLVAVVGLVFSGCDVLTQANDQSRTGWYPASPAVTPEAVTSGHFGQLFSASVTGPVFAQPVARHNIVLVATEANNVYGIDSTTGAQVWSRNVGVPWNTSDIDCPDLGGTSGITGTPVIDDATNTAFLVAKQYVSGTSGPSTFYAHALDLVSGAERPGFPVRITGNASNVPTLVFNPTNLIQRPGLLLSNGMVYAAFGSICDHIPYAGWVVGISESGAFTTRWASVRTDTTFGASIWQSGGAIASDGPGQILLVTGNGQSNATQRPGSQPGLALGESVVRLAAQPDRSLRAVDFFSPSNAVFLDSVDQDLGSGAPVVLPSDPFSTPAHPSLVATAGKEGYLYLLDARDLGGMKQGPGGTDKVVARVGPLPRQFGKLGVWPGDGGYLYVMPPQQGPEFASNDNRVHAFHWGVDGSGNPTLTDVGTTTEPMSYGSTAAVVTSQGRTSGSAVLWVVDDEVEIGGTSQLRAYNAVPVGGHLNLLWSASIGNAARWTVPADYLGRMYVGTSDGRLLAFAMT